MKPASLPLPLALLALLLLGISGAGVRLGLWQFGTGFTVMRWSAYVAAAALLFGIVLLAMPRARLGRVSQLTAAVLIAFAAGAVPVYWIAQGRDAAPIHDVSTDTDNPPPFRAVIPLRAAARNPIDYGGPEVAQWQHRSYPDIMPLVLNVPPDAAFAKALEGAKQMGWDVVAADAKSGRIEATATTLWFGFKDDVVVRITPAPGGSRIDVRSLSRVGGSDVGANAKRIRSYLAKLRE